MSDQWDRKWSKSDYSGAKWRKPFQKEEMNNSVKYCQHVEQDEDEGMTQIWQHGSHCWRFVWGVVRMIDCTECLWQRMGEAQILPSFPWDPRIHFTLTTLFTIILIGLYLYLLNWALSNFNAEPWFTHPVYSTTWAQIKYSSSVCWMNMILYSKKESFHVNEYEYHWD